MNERVKIPNNSEYSNYLRSSFSCAGRVILGKSWGFLLKDLVPLGWNVEMDT